jgi:hypothetical protein
MNNVRRQVAGRPLALPSAHVPSTTNRRQFKVWLTLQLIGCGVELSTDPSYRDLQAALSPIFERLTIREG